MSGQTESCEAFNQRKNTEKHLQYDSIVLPRAAPIAPCKILVGSLPSLASMLKGEPAVTKISITSLAQNLCALVSCSSRVPPEPSLQNLGLLPPNGIIQSPARFPRPSPFRTELPVELVEGVKEASRMFW